MGLLCYAAFWDFSFLHLLFDILCAFHKLLLVSFRGCSLRIFQFQVFYSSHDRLQYQIVPEPSMICRNHIPWGFFCATVGKHVLITFLITVPQLSFALVYTSDAADDLLCVDLGGRRI